jgi:HK97 family phage portal protein
MFGIGTLKSLFSGTAPAPDQETTEQRNAQAPNLFLPSFANPWTTAIDTPTKITTVYSSVRLLSSVVADTPIRHLKKEETQQGTKIQRLLDSPNTFSTRFDLISNLTQDLVLKGNGFLYYDTEENTLWYLPYDQVQIYITQEYQSPLHYQVQYFGKDYTFYPDEIIHVKNPLTSGSGYIGLSCIEQHKQLFDTAKSHTDYLKSFQDNAAQIQLVIETDKRLNQESVEQFQKGFSKRFSGSKSAGRIPLLHDGLKAKQLSKITPADADYLKTMNLTKMEIAEIFGVPPSILGFSEQKYSNQEQQHISFQNYTVSPILTAIEQELTKKLIPSYRTNERIAFRPETLKYVSADEKSKALSLLKNSGIITPNEARSYYDLPEMDDPDADKLQKENTSTAQTPETIVPEDTNTTNNQQLPMTDSRSRDSGSGTDSGSSIFEEIKKEIHKLKTDNGRLRTELKKLKGEG